MTLATGIEQELAQRLHEIETQEHADEIHARLGWRSLAVFLGTVAALAVIPLLLVVLI